MAAMVNHVAKLLAKADACLDLISVHKIDFFSLILRAAMPPGFWGDRHTKNIACHPQKSEIRVYLTFDDGPSPSTTPFLLEMLRQEKIQASFFLIGKAAEKYPHLVEAIHKDGHSIGNHSYKHLFMPALTSRQIENEIERTNCIIKDITGAQPQIFRPPYGFMDRRAAAALKARSMYPVYWTQAPEDWSIPGSARVIRRLSMRLAAGNVIVLHEGQFLEEQTMAAAKELIYRCKTAGFNLEKVQLSA